MEKYQIKLGRLRKLSRRMNSGISLFLIIRGKAGLEMDGITYELNEGGIAVVGNTEIFSMESDGSSVVLSLLFPREYLAGVFPEALKRRIVYVSAGESLEDSDYAALRRLASDIAFRSMRRAEGHELKVQSEIFELFHCILTGIAGREGLAAAENGGADGRLSAVLSDIHQNFRYSLSLNEAAKKVFLSPQYLSRLFREKMGVTFLEYLNALRLSEAANALLQSETSIARIALDSGFPSEKSFSRQFRKKYDVTPSEYRRANYLGGQEEGSHFEQMEDVSLEAFVKFVGAYTPEVQKERRVLEQIDMTAEPQTIYHENLIDVGNIWLALREDIRMQLEMAQKILDCRYVRVTVMEHPEFMGVGDKIGQQYDYYYAFSLFSRLGLVPFIHVKLEDLKSQGSQELLCSILDNLKKRNDRGYFREWRLELEGGEDQEEILEAVCRAVREVCPDMIVGLTVDADRRREAVSDFLSRRRRTVEPAFLTMKGDPNLCAAPREPDAYRSFQESYYRKRMEKLNNILGDERLPVFLVEWNTLTGATVAEAGEFHRTALIADVMCSLAEDAAGFGFWLSLFAPEALKPELCTYPLSLYFYQEVPRPLMFAAQSLGGRKLDFIFRKDNVVCLRRPNGEYVLVIFNPCYQEPFRSMDNVIREQLSCTFELHLGGLEEGEYYFKRYVLDKKNGSLYHNWVNVDFNLARYEDVAVFLRGAVAPALSMYRQEEKGEVVLKQELTMNAMMVYIIGRMNP